MNRSQIAKHLRTLLVGAGVPERLTCESAIEFTSNVETFAASLEAGLTKEPNRADVMALLTGENVTATQADYVCRVLAKNGII